MASTQEMKKICIEVLPDYCCIVPEKGGTNNRGWA